MLDFLLKNQPEFLQKFRQYSKESFVFLEAVNDYIEEEKIIKTDLSNEIALTYLFDKTFGEEDFKITFSDNLNFILAKNKLIEEDGTCKAYIFINNAIGSTKMNCHVIDYNKNSFPIDFTLEGIGSVEHFFLNKGLLEIHELKFGTWCPPNQAEEFRNGRILNLFPAILNKDEPSIEIRFSKSEENMVFQFQFNSGKPKEEGAQRDDFNIAFTINKQRSDFLISSYKDPTELRSYMIADIKNSTQSLIYDSVSNWLSRSIDIKNILSEADSEEIKITYEILPEKFLDQLQEAMISELLSQAVVLENLPFKADIKESKIPRDPHPAEEELQEIEKCDEGESRARSNPNQKIKNPEAKNVEIKNWFTEKKLLR